MVHIYQINACRIQIFYYYKLYFKNQYLNGCSNCTNHTYLVTSEKYKYIHIILNTISYRGY